MKIDDAKIKQPPSSRAQSFQPKRLSAFSDMNRSEIVYLDESVLIPYKKQARKIFNQEEIEHLAHTIKEHGVRQPLTVIKGQSDSSFYEVVSGERRLRACRLLSLSKIPCIILTNIDQAEEIALIENIQRQDLHPLELSDAINQLILKKGWNQSDVAKKLSISPSTVSELLKLQIIDKEIKSIILKMNVRGRDELRQLSSMKTGDEQKAYLLSYSKKDLINENSQEKKELKPKSVFRINKGNNGFKIQDKSLDFLPQQDLKIIKSLFILMVEKINRMIVE
ncbi:MAG: Nucleoid occlusion protein [Holosporales bacterium]